ACSRSQSSGPVEHETDKAPIGETDAAVTHHDPLADAGAALNPTEYNGPYLYAIYMQTPVMSDMEWPIPDGSKIRDPAREAVKRIGYMRRGARVPVIAEAHRKSNCLDGWYELLSGGFVCGKYATLDANHPRVRLAPHPPYMDQALPYEYGYNLTNGTPLYRTLPSRKDRVEFEPWLSGRARPKRGIETDNPYGDLDAGAAPLNDPYATASNSTSTDDLDAGATPWYLRDWDGGKPQVSLDELNEDSQGPILRRMVRGFYLALDKTERDPRDKNRPEYQQTKWWKTTSGYFAPFDRIVVNTNVSDFHGVWLNEPPPAGAPTTIGNPPRGDAGPEPITPYATTYPVGFILWNGHQYTLAEDGKRMTRGASVARFTTVGLTGKSMESGGHLFYETQNGWWMRMADGRITRPLPPPRDLKPGEKWIDVNLTQQTLVAFEGEKPVFATVISSGKKNRDNPEKNHETKAGIFRIREKHIAATMDGDVASDGPYSIEDVPWIMYFNGSIALHGAFWHTAFGSMKSHGCVNMAPLDARAMFAWTDPPLPEGWHGVWATPDHPGTRIVVHDEEDDRKNGCTPQNPGCKR
ncbi:MAG: L,D-transpeptidase, partial [Polyangiaceae bacterium]